jgi:hypothetical protein
MRRIGADRRAMLAVKVALTGLFLYFANRRLSTDHWAMIAGGMRWPGLALAAGLGAAGLAFQAERWLIILRYEGFGARRAAAWKTLLFGTLLAFVTPGRIGELLRGVGLDPDRTADAAFAVVVDKLFTVAATFACGAACLLVQVRAYGVGAPRILYWGLAAAAAAGCVCLVLFFRGGIIRLPSRIEEYRLRMLRMIPRAVSPAGGRAILYSLIAHACLLVQTAVLMGMFGGLDFQSGVLAAGQAYAVMVFLPFAIANIGVREYSFGLFMAALHDGPADHPVTAAALGVSVAILLINIVAPASVGLLWSVFDFKADGDRR